MFKYVKLGNFTYNIIKDKKQVKLFLLKWIGEEWRVDHKEFPGQLWTLEWMSALKNMSFRLEIINLGKINLRKDLMSYKKGGYSFKQELKERASEREESMLRGVSIEPLLINGNNFELMDGYTRYTVLKKYGEKEAYAYVGIE
jgi:hypothetical protein